MPPVAEGGQAAKQGGQACSQAAHTWSSCFPGPRGRREQLSAGRGSPQACTQELGGKAEGQQRGQSYFMFLSFFLLQAQTPKVCWTDGWMDRQMDARMDE